MVRFASFSAAFFVLVFATTYYVLLALQSGEPFRLPTFQTQGKIEIAEPSTKKVELAVEPAAEEPDKSAVENSIEPSLSLIHI